MYTCHAPCIAQLLARQLDAAMHGLETAGGILNNISYALAVASTALGVQVADANRDLGQAQFYLSEFAFFQVRG